MMSKAHEVHEVKVDSGVSGLEIVVDAARCCGYGICADICPDVYSLDERGFVKVAGPVPAGLETAAREAAEACPGEVLHVRRADS